MINYGWKVSFDYQFCSLFTDIFNICKKEKSIGFRNSMFVYFCTFKLWFRMVL